MATLLLYLLALQVKHVIIDYVLQTQEQIHNKGTYGNWVGFTHSLEHAFGTFFITVAFMLFGLDSVSISLLIGITLLDLVVHYNVDWFKMNFGCKDMTNKLFWWHLGMDQFAHQATYLLIAFILFC